MTPAIVQPFLLGGRAHDPVADRSCPKGAAASEGMATSRQQGAAVLQGYWPHSSMPSKRAPSATGRPPSPPRRGPHRGRRVEILVEGPAHRGQAAGAVSGRGAAPQGQAGGGRRHVLVGAPVPVVAVVVSEQGQAHRGGSHSWAGDPRRPGCRATWTSWCRPGRPGRRGTTPARRACPSPTGTGPSHSWWGKTNPPPPWMSRVFLSSRNASAEHSMCHPGRPGPRATPTPARRAGTAATGRSRAGRACWDRRGCRRARRPAPACAPGRSR